MGLSSEETSTVLAINIVSSSFSLLGSLFVIIVYCGFPEVRNYSFRLVLYLSICDLLLAFSTLLGPMDDNDNMCIAQGVLISYFGLASIVWSAILSLSLYLFVVKQNMHVPDFEFRFAIFAVLFPLLMSLLPLTTDSYKNDIGDCWIPIAEKAGLIWAIFQFYVPLWLTVTFNAFCFYLAVKELRALIEGIGSLPEDERQLKLDNVKRLRYYPLVLVVCWTFACINAIYSVCSPDEPSYVLTLLDKATGSMQGFLDAIVYGLNPTVKQALTGTYMACCPCFYVRQRPNKI